MKKTNVWVLGAVLASFVVGATAMAGPLILKSIDKTWNRYTSLVYGFTIKVPKTAWFSYAKCAYTTANGDHSYRPKGGYEPVQVFADGADRYITQAYYYQLTGQTKQNGISYFSGCVKKTNSITLLKKKNNFYEADWKISVRSVKNDNALSSLIKKVYGSSCTWKKTKSDQAGVYNVSIIVDGKPLDQTSCPVNFAVAIKYYPAKHKVAYWDLGQSVTFWNKKANKDYDTAMVKSFRFQ